MKSHDAGLTIIELMISLLLASVLTSGVFYMVSGQTKTYRSEVSKVGLQQNMSGAAEYLARQIRMAGYGFGRCPGGVVNQWDGAAGTTASTYRAVQFYNSCNLRTTAPASCPTAPIGNPDAPDSFTVTYAQTDSIASSGVRIVNAMPASSANIEVNAPGGFKQGDIVALWQPGTTTACTLMRLTHDPQAIGGGGVPSYHLQHHPDGLYNPPGGQNIFPAGGYGAGTLVINLTRGNAIPRHFAVDTTTNPSRLVTWTTANADPSSDTANLEPIADNVEDMQVAWACDVNNDGAYDEGATVADRTTDEWGGNVANDTLPTCGVRPIGLVRLTIIARGASPEMDNKLGFRPAAEDRAAGSASEDLSATSNMGTYTRRTVSLTAAPYNLIGENQ